VRRLDAALLCPSHRIAFIQGGVEPPHSKAVGRFWERWRSGRRSRDMIRVLQIAKRWPRFSFEVERLEIGEGEYFVLLGPSGAGKTVLLQCLAGLTPPDRGRVFFGEQDVTALPPERRNVGWVSQVNTLFPHLTVMKNIQFGRKYSRSPGPRGRRDSESNEFDQRVRRLIQMLDIGDLLDRAPAALSGGEVQRVMLARALALAPRILLLDEPLRGLDPTTQERLREELARLHRELGTTTIHITHDHVEARALADRIAVIRLGRIEQVGPADEVFERPATPFVARFTGAENLFALSEPTPRAPAFGVHASACVVPPAPILDRAILPEGLVPAAATHIAVRPEHVEVWPAEVPVSTLPRSALRLPGTIETVVQHGGWLRFTIAACNVRWTAFVHPREAARNGLLPGRQVVIAVPAEKIHVPGQVSGS
jgi:molybdate/tungstate transport system ATP-binding protein